MGVLEVNNIKKASILLRLFFCLEFNPLACLIRVLCYFIASANSNFLLEEGAGGLNLYISSLKTPYFRFKP